jgi:integrase
MTIRKDPTSGVYHCDFQIGARRTRESTGTRDEDEARAYEAKRRSEVFAEVKLGVKPASAEGPEATFGEVMRSYLADVMAPRVRTNSKRSTVTTVSMAGVLLAEIGDATPLSGVADKVKAWVKGCRAALLKPSTINRKLAILRAALNHHGFAYGDTLPAEEEEGDRVRFLATDEAARLFRALASNRVLLDFVVFLLDTGARRSEALDLEWPSIDLDRTDAAGRPRATVKLRDSKSRKIKYRSIPVSERLLPILRRMHARRTGRHVWPWDSETLAVRGRDPLARKTGTVTPIGVRPPGVSKSAPWHAWIKHDGKLHHLRCERTGTGTFETEAEAIAARRAAELEAFRPEGPEVSGLRYAWEKAVAEAEVVDFHMHDCRHDFATRWLRATHSIATVSKLLGHASVKMTEKYAHLDASDFDTAADLVDAKAAGAPLRFDAPPRDDEPIVIAELHRAGRRWRAERDRKEGVA